MIPLNQLIRDHRKKAGLAQAELAKLAGVGKTVVWDLEHGKESVQWDTIQRILRVLNITPEWRSPLLERMAGSAAASSPPTSSRSLSATSPTSSSAPSSSASTRPSKKER